MRIRTLRGLTLCAVALSSATAHAQIRSGGVAAAQWNDLQIEAPIASVPAPDVAAYMADDEARNHIPLRYGAVIPAAFDMATDGAWEEVDGGLVWRLEIASPGAKSLGLEFSKYDLPEGAQLFLYDAALENVYGAYTERNEQPDGEFVIEPFPGDRAILEYFQPAWVEGEAEIAIDHVIYDYRGIFELERGLNIPNAGGEGGDGGCSVDVNCPEGDPYEAQKRATVRTLSNGGLCSGALINNTNNDGTQYVLTAQHCGQTNNCVFRFNYQRANCGSGSSPTGQQVSGCTVLASDTDTDNRLLRINNQIPSNYDPFFAGWDRNSANATFWMSMHHPGGFQKEISIDNNGGGKSTQGFQGIGNVRVWNATFQIGGTAGGSSGGPLFDQNNRIRGALTGGPGTNCTVNYYGRFFNFWQDVSSVEGFLDPSGTGATFVDGYDPGGGPGGGPTAPNIESVFPPTISAITIDGPPNVTLTGTGFNDVTEVRVNGVPVSTFPAQFVVVSDVELRVTVEPQDALGIVEIEVIDNLGSDTTQIGINANLAPTLDLINSTPNFLFNAVGLDVYMAGLPNDTFVLTGSLVNTPSSLPGIVDLAIGADFFELLVIGSFSIDPVKGWTFVNVPLGAGLPGGTVLYLQGASLSSIAPTLPLTPSNVQEGLMLF